MKHLLLTTIAAVLVVGCGESKPPEPPDISINEAAERGFIETVKQHLDAGTDVNAKNDPYGPMTPLHLAASQGQKEVVELLIDNGADVNVNDGGTTPLDVAIIQNKTETADLLRKHGGKTSEELEGDEPVSKAATPEPPKGKAPDISIHLAASAGHIAAVKQHLAAGADVNAKDDEGYTPLYAVAGGVHKEIAVLLIANGADVNAKNKYGETPLHYAATKEIAELLIAKGADVNAKDEVESTPLHTAALNGHKEVTELLIANKAKVNTLSRLGATPLDTAILRKQPETADLLRKHGGKTGEELKAAGKPVEPVAEAVKSESTTVKAPDISIHEASEEGNIETIKQHLAAGTDVNAKESFFQMTPLHRACLFGRKEVVKMLVANGADVNAKDDDMMTALSYATTGEDKEIVELLLDKGANLKDEVGPPLLEVTNKGIFKLLIAAGVDVNAKDDRGETALHRAALKGYNETCELLIAKGADLNAKDEDGETPLDLAESVFPTLQVKAAKKEIADLLRKHGGKTGEELKAEGR